MKSILVAVKLDVEYGRLIGALTDLVATQPRRIHLANLVVVGTGDDQRDRHSHAQGILDELAESLRGAGHDVQTHLAFATIGVGHQVVDLAEEHGADLIVIGLAKRSRVGKALMGSDAQSIIMQAPCPVLSVRLAY